MPSGDPAALREIAIGLRAAGGAVAGVGRGLDADQSAVLDHWRGQAAGAFQASVGMITAGSHAGGQAMLDTSIVVEHYATTLEWAQQQARALNAELAGAQASLAATLGGMVDGDPDATRLTDRAQGDYQDTAGWLTRRYEGVTGELQAAAYQARARMEEIAARAGRLAGQSPERIVQGFTDTLETELPALRPQPG